MPRSVPSVGLWPMTVPSMGLWLMSVPSMGLWPMSVPSMGLGPWPMSVPRLAPRRRADRLCPYQVSRQSAAATARYSEHCEIRH
eukprot:1202797-Rhodomonas_salina.1